VIRRVLRLNTFSQVTSLLAAQHRGFLEEEGLALDVEIAVGSRPQMEGLLSGRYDLVHTNADNVMRFRAAGHSDLSIVLVLDTGIAQKLIVAPDITDWADLRGRPVGVDAPDSGYAFVLYELLRLHGLERGDYEVVPLGATGFRLEGLQRGEIVAGLLSHHHEATAVDEGFRILIDTQAHFGGHPGVTVATTTSWAEDDADALQGYTRALLRAADWAVDPAHRDEVVELVAEARGVDEARARRIVEIEAASRTSVVRTVEDAERSLAETASLRARYTGVVPTGYFSPTAMGRALIAAADRDAV
jgi:ABC-type nitrate/sulfonate/bicarbonate transport system substrate-binding protein